MMTFMQYGTVSPARMSREKVLLVFYVIKSFRLEFPSSFPYSVRGNSFVEELIVNLRRHSRSMISQDAREEKKGESVKRKREEERHTKCPTMENNTRSIICWKFSFP